MTALRYLSVAVGNEYVDTLTPRSCIVPSKNPEFDWCSTGDDPAFEIRTRLPFYPGWYMFELNVSGTMQRFHSRFFFDDGEGFRDEHSANFPGSTGKVQKRLVYLDRKTYRIRFDPVEFCADFSINSLRIVPVTQNFAAKRMLKKVLTQQYAFENFTVDSLKEELMDKASRSGVPFIGYLKDKYDKAFTSASSGDSYDNWIAQYEVPLYGDKDILELKLSRFKLRPLISIVMPVYNVGEQYLREAIDSVLDQAYDNWQLCIVDDGSSEKHIKPVLEEYAARDSRIQVEFSSVNKHIAAASNQALSLANGDYIAFLDHDDVLAPHALFCVVEQLNATPEAQLIYSDEDKIDAVGQRLSPFFKPDWNPDLFYSYNYICHFTVLKSELIKSIGGFREGVDGSQDYDLVLRAIEKTDSRHIEHIPQILYHWRTIEGSVASGAEQKSYTTDAGIKALQDHFESKGMSGVQVQKGCSENLYRVRYPLPEQQPNVSLIVPTRNGLDLLKPCIESILEKTTYTNYEIIVVDNQSDEKATLDYLQEISSHAQVRVIHYDRPFNYSAINNYAVGMAKGDIIGLVNNDIKVIDGDWLSEMVSQANRPEIGCVGAKLLYEDNTVQHAGVILGLGGCAGHSFIGLDKDEPGYYYRAQLTQNYSAVTAACLLLRKDAFAEAGGLDEENFKVAFNDVDLCLKVGELGLRNLWTPYALLYHLESRSRGYEDTPEKKKRFDSEVAAMKLRWAGKLRRDPAYNPNLGLGGHNFQIKS